MQICKNFQIIYIFILFQIKAEALYTESNIEFEIDEGLFFFKFKFSE